MLEKYNCILWDFDGVLIDSEQARIAGFEQVLAQYPAVELEALLEFHKRNGGLSRYVKFRHFFEIIRKEPVSENQIETLAAAFSDIMKKTMTNPALLIDDALSFVRIQRIPMHIVSGSDGKELRFLCSALGIDHYFKSISGSPTPKIQLVKNLIENGWVVPRESCLIGDSFNDLEAAELNGIAFYGYNNPALKGCGMGYIDRFSDL